eukprot:s3871_g4.t2
MPDTQHYLRNGLRVLPPSCSNLANHGDGDCSLCHMPQLAHDFVQRFGLQHAYLRSRGQSWEQRWEEREAHQEATQPPRPLSSTLIGAGTSVVGK